MPVSLREAAKRLKIFDHREVRGIARFLGISLQKQGEAKMLLMEERDLQRIKDEWQDACNQN